MSTPRSRNRKLLLGGMAVVCLGLASYIGYVLYAKGSTKTESIDDVEKDYAAGVEAYEKGDFKTAADKFDSARLRGLKILLDAKKTGETNTAKAMPAENFGKLQYVYAKAIRDLQYSRGQRDGKPLAEREDTSDNERYRSYMVIPDMKDREEAVEALRSAAERLPRNAEVLRDTLRVELVLVPTPLDRVIALCRQILDINPNDGRALYQLAKHEFEQPTLQSGWRETDPSKRSIERVEKSLQYVRRAMQSGKSPYWRTAFLEAEILGWLEQKAGNKKSREEYHTALYTLLFDPASGALSKVARDEVLNLPNHQLDLHGLLGIQQNAIALLVNEARTVKAREDDLANTLTTFLETAGKARNTAIGKAQASQSLITLAVMDAAVRAQLVLAKAPHSKWPAAFAACWANAKETDASNLNRPEIILHLASLNTNEAYYARRRGNGKDADEIEKRLFDFLKDAIDDAEKQKRPAAVKDALERVTLEAKYRAGKRGSELAPHIEALKLSARADMQARAHFYEALVAQRTGRLAKARTTLESVIANKELADLHLRARLELIQVLITMGQPEPALSQLRDLEPLLERPDELAPAELAWRDDVIQTLDEFRAMMVVAQLEASFARIMRHARENPGKPIPPEIGASYEKAAENYLIRLKPGSPADETARLATFNYWLRIGKREPATATLKTLEARLPNSLRVLEARVRYTMLAPEKIVGTPESLERELRDRADGLIHDYIARNESSRDAKLFWARWLTQTGRGEEALTYLQDKKNFADEKDAAVARTLAQVLIRQGKPEAAQRILDSFPADPSIELALINAAATREEQEKRLQDALKRYENTGLIRLYESALRLGDGKFEDAINGFLEATDYEPLKSAAQAGLLRALLAFATEKPGTARDTIIRFMKDYPKEPILAVGAAVAAFNLDDIGTPTADWNTSRSMGAALARWEQLADANLSRALLGLVKAQFWYQAGRSDAARLEAMRGMTKDNYYLPSISFLLNLAIESRNADQIKPIKEWVAESRQKNPKALALLLLDAQIRQFEGTPESVVPFYEVELAAAPKEPVLYDRLVGYLFAKDKKKEALEWTRKWREALPESDAARLAMVQMLAANGELSEALKMADEYLKRQMDMRKKQLAEVKPPPSTSAAFKDWPKRQEDLLKETERGSYIQVAIMLARGKKIDEAIDYAKRSLKEKDDYLPGLLQVGDLLLAKKNYAEACKNYRTILEKSPRHLLAANNLAYTLAENLNEPAEAMKVIDKYRKDAGGEKPLNTDRLPAAMLDTLGVVYLKLKDPARHLEMRQIFESAVQRYPRDPRMYLYLGLACIEVGFKNQAVPYLRAAEKMVTAANFKDLSDTEKDSVLNSVKTALKRIEN